MVILQRQRLELYKKASFVHYSMEINCTSLRFIMITVTVFWLVWIGALPDDTIHIWTAALISSLQVFVPHCSQNITLKLWKLPVLVQQPEVLLHTYHTHFYTHPKTIVSGVANVKVLVPTIHHLQTQDKCNIQQYCCITIIHGFIWLEARHISSGLSHHIHNIKCLWFWFEHLQYNYCNNCVEVRNVLIFHMTSNYVPILC